MTDNSYWQFQSMVDATPLLLPQQSQQSQQSPQQSQPQQTQRSWSEENDERKWVQNFSDFDMTSQTNNMFSK